MVLDSYLNVYQHWENQKEVAVKGYSNLVQSTRKLLNSTLNGNSTSFPFVGHFDDPVNGPITVWITALKFDAPSGSYTYYICTGQNEMLLGALEDKFMNMVSKDLMNDYEVTFVAYFIAYAVFLLSLECLVQKRIVSPIIDLIAKIKKPMQKRSKSTE